MGMSTGVIGIKPPDEKWKKMKAIYDACEIAGIEVPEEVEKFFNWEKPEPKGVVIDEDSLGDAVQEYNGYAESGYEIHIDKLPKDVKIIRVTNSW